RTVVRTLKIEAISSGYHSSGDARPEWTRNTPGRLSGTARFPAEKTVSFLSIPGRLAVLSGDNKDPHVISGISLDDGEQAANRGYIQVLLYRWERLQIPALDRRRIGRGAGDRITVTLD
ncbi:MAG: hypothetical protein PHV74_15350, partial [Dehalococcoidia bacterium]|nr:hypothetical protein [Dehalococcoidia bacterium]